MDKISIVVAVYNAEKHLKKCIDSLLNQTYNNFEIILVDDCSSDNSFMLCETYLLNDNIIVKRNSLNQGVSATRNRGIELATGKYICFVDSDDYVEPKYLEELYNSLNKYNSKLSICGCEYHNYVDKSSNYFLWSKESLVEIVSLSKGFELSSALYLNALWNKLFSTKLIKDNNIKFDVNLSMGEDAKFTLEYIKINDIKDVVVISKPLYHYNRWNNDSLMSKYYQQANGDYSENLRLLYDVVKPLNNKADEIYNNSLINLKNNLKYSVIRSGISKSKKISAIRNLYPNYSELTYFIDNLSLLKEKIHKIFKR